MAIEKKTSAASLSRPPPVIHPLTPQVAILLLQLLPGLGGKGGGVADWPVRRDPSFWLWLVQWPVPGRVQRQQRARKDRQRVPVCQTQSAAPAAAPSTGSTTALSRLFRVGPLSVLPFLPLLSFKLFLLPVLDPPFRVTHSSARPASTETPVALAILVALALDIPPDQFCVIFVLEAHFLSHPRPSLAIVSSLEPSAVTDHHALPRPRARPFHLHSRCIPPLCSLDERPPRPRRRPTLPRRPRRPRLTDQLAAPHTFLPLLRRSPSRITSTLRPPTRSSFWTAPLTASRAPTGLADEALQGIAVLSTHLPTVERVRQRASMPFTTGR